MKKRLGVKRRSKVRVKMSADEESKEWQGVGDWESRLVEGGEEWSRNGSGSSREEEY